MEIVGYFESSRPEFQLGESVSVTLFVRNQGKETAYLLVPRGRADGIRIQVKEGTGFQLSDMTQEPEPGLVPETKVSSGETYSQEFPLSKWLVLGKPGPYTLECAVDVKTSDKSLRDSDQNRVSLRTTIQSDVHFVVLAAK
jgi:hypothetical protein